MSQAEEEKDALLLSVVQTEQMVALNVQTLDHNRRLLSDAENNEQRAAFRRKVKEAEEHLLGLNRKLCQLNEALARVSGE